MKINRFFLTLCLLCISLSSCTEASQTTTISCHDFGGKADGTREYSYFDKGGYFLGNLNIVRFCKEYPDRISTILFTNNQSYGIKVQIFSTDGSRPIQEHLVFIPARESKYLDLTQIFETNSTNYFLSVEGYSDHEYKEYLSSKKQGKLATSQNTIDCTPLEKKTEFIENGIQINLKCDDFSTSVIQSLKLKNMSKVRKKITFGYLGENGKSAYSTSVEILPGKEELVKLGDFTTLDISRLIITIKNLEAK